MPRRYTILTNLRQTSTNSQQARHKLTSGMWRCLPDKLKHDQAAGGSARTAVAAPTARQSHVGSFVLFSSFEMKNINVLKLLLFLGHRWGHSLLKICRSWPPASTCAVLLHAQSTSGHLGGQTWRHYSSSKNASNGSHESVQEDYTDFVGTPILSIATKQSMTSAQTWTGAGNSVLESRLCCFALAATS
jgi:hypothetical protein